MVLLDECNLIINKPPLLDLISDIPDVTATPMLMTGMRDFPRHVANIEHLAGRVSEVIEFEPLRPEDTRLVVETVCEIALGDDLIFELHRNVAVCDPFGTDWLSPMPGRAPERRQDGRRVVYAYGRRRAASAADSARRIGLRSEYWIKAGLKGMAEDFEMLVKPASSTAEVAAAESRLAVKLLHAISDPQLDRATRTRHLQELAQTLDKIVTAADRLVGVDSLPAERGKGEHGNCWYCGMPQQPSEADLAKHIGEAVQTASWAG